MPSELNLPRLRKEGRVRSPAKGGIWTRFDQLNELATALEVEAGKMLLRDIKSVPHTWGHVIVFETALFNENHPAHEDAKGQWRALLTMLALRNRPGYSVRTKSVSLGEALGAEAAVQQFTRVAGREQLSPRIDSESGWDPVYLLYAQVEQQRPGDGEVLVGMLSPSAIVVPARDFAGDGRLTQPWVRGGLLDPLATGAKGTKLSPDELEVCRLFATQSSTAVREQGAPPHPDSANTIARLLDEFAENLQDRGAKHHIATWSMKQQDDLVARNPRGVYRAVNAVWQDTGNSAEVTDLELAKLRLENETVLKLVLADPKCANSLGRAPEFVSLFGRHTLADLEDADSQGSPNGIPEHLLAEAAKCNILLLGPDDLLAQRLTTLKEFATNAHPAGFQTKLLPVKPAALLLHPSLDELKDHIDLLGSETQPQVALRTTLTDRRGNKYEHAVSKMYGASDSGTLDTAYAPEALSAWPDFQMQPTSGGDYAQDLDWRWNFLFTSTNVSDSPQGRSVIGTSGVSRTMLERDLARPGVGYGPERVRYCRERLAEWSGGDGPWSGVSGAEKPWFEWLRIHQAVPSKHEKILQRCDWAFDAVVFRVPSADGDSYAGLGILPPARGVRLQDVAAGGVAEIACDFGSSNTIVYRKRGQGAAEPLPFTPRLRRFNQKMAEGRSVDRTEEYSAFMPASKVDHPFSTIMQIRRSEGVEDLVQEWKSAGEPPLWRDYAFFDPNVLHLTESLLSGAGGTSLILDLKWGTEPDARKRMARYLRHITMLSLAEVMGDRGMLAPSLVKWHFSFPIAIPHRASYTEVIEFGALEDHERRHGVEFHTESHAALNYFRGVELSEPKAMLVLDIGGGSTDIALEAHRTSAVWQYSIKLAGDDLMTEFLLYNRSFLRDLELAGVGHGHVFGDRASERAFMNPPSDQLPSRIDRNAARAIINSPVFQAAFDRAWVNIRHTENVKRLRAGASVLMGGLCHYLGLQIQSLLQWDSDALLEEDLTTIRLCFAGRGSTLFKRWQNDESFVGQMVKLTAFAAHSKEFEERRESVQAFFSHDMKHEAAKGMLSPARADSAAREFRLKDGDFRVTGIGASLDENLEATAVMEDLRGKYPGTIKPVVAWDDFRSFIEGVGKECGFSVRIAGVAEESIATKGKEAYINLLHNSGVIEPPFVAMLRTTMRLIYEGRNIKLSWAD